MTPEAAGKWPRLRYIACATAVVFGVWWALDVFAKVTDIIFMGFLGLLMALILEYPVGWLAKRKVPRAVGVLITLALVLGIGAGIVALAAPLVQEQGQKVAEQAPAAIDKIEQWGKGLGIGDVSGKLQSEGSNLLNKALPVVKGTVSALGGIVMLFIMALFLAYDPKAYLKGTMKLVPRRHEQDARVLVGRVGGTLRHWMVGTLISMTIIGTLTAVGALILGIKGWLVLGILAFFGEFIPYIGPIVTAIPGVLMALADSPEKALWAVLMYVAVQQIEGTLVQPLVMKRAVKLHPALVLIWQLLAGAAFGIFGILVATPLLAVLKVTVDYLYVERALGKASSV